MQGALLPSARRAGRVSREIHIDAKDQQLQARSHSRESALVIGRSDCHDDAARTG
jgi:hypothetical protein